MSREKIQNSLFDLEIAIRKTGCDTNASENIAGDVAWYIYTGRASLDYIRTFCGLSKYRMNTLARKISAGGSTDAIIAASKRYLKIE